MSLLPAVSRRVTIETFRATAVFSPMRRAATYFRTIKPVSYTLQGIFRTAHIHFAVSRSGRRVFTSQMLVEGEPGNVRDGIVRRLSPAALKTLLVPFTPVPASRLGELAANFDVVLGRTAAEDDAGQLRGVAAPLSRRGG